MYEFWLKGEKLNQVTKEMIQEYVHQTRESQLVKVPIMKSVAGEDFAEASSPKTIFTDKSKRPRRKNCEVNAANGNGPS